MANPNWAKGTSGNPKGRPKKNRALTEILDRAGSKTVEVDGKSISGKRLLARLLWEIVTFGKCTLPNGTELTVNSDGWFDIVKFIYAQIDGPPKQDIGLEHSGEVDIVGLREQLAHKLDCIADAGAAAGIPGESD